MQASKNRIPVLFTAVTLLLAASGTSYGLTSYTGELLYPSQIVAGGAWSSPTTYFKWTVSDNENGWWNYNYTVRTSTPEISHFIFGLSTSITRENLSSVISNFTVNGNLYDLTGTNFVGPTLFSSGPANPGFPPNVSFYGLKIENVMPEATTWNVSFNAQRKPVWGDLYVKGGSNSYAYNAGLDGTFDATNYVTRNGTASDWKLAVPDTEAPVIPEASTLVLGAMGLISSGGYLFKRRK